jgi:hypothetical protein
MNRVINPLVALASVTFLLGAACSPSSQGSKGAVPDTGLGQAPPAHPAPEPVPGDKPVTISPIERGGETVPAPAPAPGPASGEQGRIAQMEREARAIAKTTGCSTASACRTAPVGIRACGGPRSYIVYCAASTDTAALFRKLRDLEKAEKAYNEKSGMMSTCEFRMPPKAVLTGGSCREAPAGGP